MENNTFWNQDRISEEEKLRRAFNPDYPDTSEIPHPDTSPCEVSTYEEGIGETPIQ